MRVLVNTLIILSICVAAASCGHRPNDDRGNLEALWRMGERSTAVTEARAVVLRAANANEVDPNELVRRAGAIRDRLYTEPVPPVDARGARPDLRFVVDGGQLDAELRDALLHDDALVMIRAAITVGELGLRRHAIGLLDVITRPGPVALNQPMTDLETPGIAWLTAKQVALESLAQLAAP